MRLISSESFRAPLIAFENVKVLIMFFELPGESRAIWGLAKKLGR